jgi:hypothetical protein
MKLKKIPAPTPVKSNNIYSSTRKTIPNLKQILLNAGYSEEEISYLQRHKYILISPNTITRKLRSREELYIVEE